MTIGQRSARASGILNMYCLFFMPRSRKQSFKLMRSHSMSLQIPNISEWAMSVISPLLTPSTDGETVPINIPEFQRVTISGDYCAGVGEKNMIIKIIT